MSKAEFYSFTKKKIVVLGVAVLACQVSLFAAGYLLSTVLRPEPALVAANGQPCSLPGASASEQTPAQPTQSPAQPAQTPATAGSAPAMAQSTVAAEERKVTAEANNVARQPAAAVAAERGIQKQIPPEFVPPSGAPAAQPPAEASANAPAGAGATSAQAASAAGNAPGAAAPAKLANPRVAAEACDASSDLIPTVATQTDSHKYAVQIGAFLDANNALRLASEFKAKGYQPCIMKAADKQGRRWTVVRMGAFDDVGKASLYARSISGREQTVALVRPADAF